MVTNSWCRYGHVLAYFRGKCLRVRIRQDIGWSMVALGTSIAEPMPCSFALDSSSEQSWLSGVLSWNNLSHLREQGKETAVHPGLHAVFVMLRNLSQNQLLIGFKNFIYSIFQSYKLFLCQYRCGGIN